MTFANETANGWQTAMLSSPVAVAPGETYTVSYLAPNGRYAYTPAFFAQTWVSGVFTAAGPDNGRYRYGTGGAAPTSSWNSTNYFVDVLYSATTPARAAPTPSATPAPSASATAAPSPSPSPSPTGSGGLLCGLLGTC
ncbi:MULTISPECIES: DUF4082 domain-containing protein [unclassified Paenarthrobacter]|uniref:DUF4082 domain-containing protein n=1 Tax=unclassified Paenarthrobacter TaxID=2634190 RepID=UPI00296F1CC1